jgi:uncharacterized LabA/DUF88 family protein
MRASVYIDGFNLYRGIMTKAETDQAWLKYKWLNLEELAKLIIPSSFDLVLTRYFTSMVKDKYGYKARRQRNYIDALKAYTENRVLIEFGRFQDFDITCKNCSTTPLRCQNCGHEYRKPNEKKTDVNLSSLMISDCIEDITDCVVLVSGDTDYEMALKVIRERFPHKSVRIACPPKRRNTSLFKYCNDGDIDITDQMLGNCLLPNPVVSPFSQTTFNCPPTWT